MNGLCNLCQIDQEPKWDFDRPSHAGMALRAAMCLEDEITGIQLTHVPFLAANERRPAHQQTAPLVFGVYCPPQPATQALLPCGYPPHATFDMQAK